MSNTAPGRAAAATMATAAAAASRRGPRLRGVARARVPASSARQAATRLRSTPHRLMAGTTAKAPNAEPTRSKK